MTTKMIRVDESDANWLTSFAGELQTARASRVSIAEAISTLIVEHKRVAEGEVYVLDEGMLVALANLVKQYPKEAVVNLLEMI